MTDRKAGLYVICMLSKMLHMQEGGKMAGCQGERIREEGH